MMIEHNELESGSIISNYDKQGFKKNKKLKESKVSKLIGNLFPAFSLYSTMLLIILLTFICLPLAYYIIFLLQIFSLYFSFHIAIYSSNGIEKLKMHYSSKNYKEEFINEIDQVEQIKLKEKQLNLQTSTNDSINIIKNYLNYDDTIHYVIIPTYHESKELISNTLNSILESKICGKQVCVIIACEMREKESKSKAQALIENYKDRFLSITASFHPPNLPNEIPGKGSNLDYAIKHMKNEIYNMSISEDNILITVCDADSLFQPEHFDYLTYTYCLDTERRYKIYQAPMINLKNYSDVPVFTKGFSIMVTMHEIACIGDKNNELIPFSTYTFSYLLLKDINFSWGKKIVTEDWRIFLKAYFETNGLCKVSPLFKPILCYSIVGSNYCSSLKERLVQAKRLSWGIREISYFISRFVFTITKCKNKKKFNPKNIGEDKVETKFSILRSLNILSKIGKMHYFAGTFIIFTIYPYFINIMLQLNYLDYKLEDYEIFHSIFSFLNGLSVTPLIIILLNTYSVFKMINLSISLKNFIFESIKIVIVFVPTQIIYSFYPTIWAATRLIYNQNFKFQVSSKPTFSDEKIKALKDRL